MPWKLRYRSDGAFRPRKLLGPCTEPSKAWISRCSKDGTGLHKRMDEAFWKSRLEWIMRDLVLGRCEEKFRRSSYSCEEYALILMLIVAALDRSRCVRMRSTSALDLNLILVQSDGVDVRVERQCRQTCVAATRFCSHSRCSRILDRTSGGRRLMGICVFFIALISCKISERFHSIPRICEKRDGKL